APPLGLEAETHGGDVQRPRHLADLVEVVVHLGAGVVDRFQRRAGELELAAGLQRHAGAVLGEGDDVVALLDGRPAEALQPLEQRAYAARALVGQRPEVVERIAELLVLGADAPSLRWLAAGLEIFDELSLAGDDFALALRWSGHASIPSIQVAVRQATARCRTAGRTPACA